MIITQLNPVWCQVSKDDIPILKQVLYYNDTYWRQGPFRKIQKPTRKFLVEKDGRFLTGFLPRVIHFLARKGIQASYDFKILSNPITQKTTPSYKLRPEQQEALDLSLENERGIIHYPTGSGKTVIFLSIVEALGPDANVLILIWHDKTLFDQTYERACEMFDDVGRIGYGMIDPARITIANTQTFGKFKASGYHNNIDVLIVDEAHHFTGDNYRMLTDIPASIRLGFTATLPSDERGKMILEGVLGPVIATKKIQEVKSLAKIKILLRKVPINPRLKDASWKLAYRLGVVYNPILNRMVVDDAAKLVEEGKTVLILVVNIDHITEIYELCRKRHPHVNISYVYGGVQERSTIKQKLSNKELDVVISNVVWREGVDIPSLGAVINAGGYKSEIMTLQAIGRGLRTTEEKKEVVLIDYFNPSNRFFIEHFGQRVCLYFDEGWIGA